jgi:2-hydroxychromene-2-carboxylate isomerase
MAVAVDCFWSFRSPYSYLATGRLVRLAAELDVAVLPIAIRAPGFFQRVDPLWLAYLLRDTTRMAEFLGIPFGWPRPDPVVHQFPSRRIAAEQPYIHRLTRLGVDAVQRGCGLAFIDQVSRLIWGGTVVGWHEGAHLAEAAARAGLDLGEMDVAIATDPARYDALIATNHADLEAIGHWGVPTFAFQGEPFFGQDRIDVLRWRLAQHGVRCRPETASRVGTEGEHAASVDRANVVPRPTKSARQT